jgi:hypothetical protein
MRNDATGIGVLDALVDRREVPPLHCNEVLDRLFDDPGRRTVERAGNIRNLSIEFGRQSDAHRQGFAHIWFRRSHSPHSRPKDFAIGRFRPALRLHRGSGRRTGGLPRTRHEAGASAAPFGGHGIS